MASSPSSSPFLRYSYSINFINRNNTNNNVNNTLTPDPEDYNSDNDDDEIEFAYVELRFTRTSSTDNNNAHVEIQGVEIGLPGLVTMEETPVLELQQALTELGVTANFHVLLIAEILERMHTLFIERDASSESTMIVVNIIEEEIRGFTDGMSMENESMSFGIVYEVEQMRNGIRNRNRNRNRDDNNAVEFDMAVTESMEITMTRLCQLVKRLLKD